MHLSFTSHSKVLAGFAAILCLSGISSLAQTPTNGATINVPASAAFRTTPFTIAGDGLLGEYWKRPINSIPTTGATIASNRLDTLIKGFGTANGTFKSTAMSYPGNDLTPVQTWLGINGASFTGTAGNLDDAAFRFKGYININAAGTLNLGTTSDDGSRITIGGIDIVNNDSGHGDQTRDTTVNFASAGVYPIEVTYFNGDWTSDGTGALLNHSGNTNASVHGGANFSLRVANGLLPASVASQLFFTVPEPSTIVLGALGTVALLAFRRRK